MRMDAEVARHVRLERLSATLDVGNRRATHRDGRRGTSGNAQAPGWIDIYHEFQPCILLQHSYLWKKQTRRAQLETVAIEAVDIGREDYSPDDPAFPSWAFFVHYHLLPTSRAANQSCIRTTLLIATIFTFW